MMMHSGKSFALLGAAGYVAPRHMEAIQQTGNRLVATFDPCDRMGIIDRYFPEADFFSNVDSFSRHVAQLQRAQTPIDYFTVCTPNYLHDEHIRLALHHRTHVICEKPLVLQAEALDGLIALEKEAERKVNCILQLRLHPLLQELKKKLAGGPQRERREVELTYISPRGKWYHNSWKGDEQKSGGVATNIGIHFFDLLYWLFGKPEETIIHQHTFDRAGGFFRFPNARVKWFVSVNGDFLHHKSSCRSLRIDGEVYTFDQGFHDLHRSSYEEILQGRGVGMEETRTSIEMAQLVRTQLPQPELPDAHPFCFLP